MATKPPAPGSVPKKTYDWGDGKGTAHSISLKNHKANVQAKQLLPYDIGGGYDPAQVRQTVNSAMDTEYGQPILTQQQQIADSQRRQNVDIPAWYQQYVDVLNSARANTAAAYANPGTQNTTPVAQTGDPTADLAAANRLAMNNSFAGLMHDQGANQNALYNTQLSNVPLQRLGSLQEQGRNTQNLQGQLGELQKQRGEYGNTYLQTMREKAQQHDADMAAAQAAEDATGAKIKFETDKLDYNHNGIPDNIEAAQTKNDSQITKWGYTNAEWRALTPEDRTSIIAAQKPPATPKENTKDYYGHTWEGNGADDKGWKNMSYSERRKAMKAAANLKSGKPSSGYTNTQKHNNESAFDYALNWYKTNGGPKSPNDANQVIDYGGAHQVKIDYKIASILNHWAHNGGHITEQEYKQLRKMGVPEDAVPEGLKAHVK